MYVTGELRRAVVDETAREIDRDPSSSTTQLDRIAELPYRAYRRRCMYGIGAYCGKQIWVWTG